MLALHYKGVLGNANALQQNATKGIEGHQLHLIMKSAFKFHHQVVTIMNGKVELALAMANYITTPQQKSVSITPLTQNVNRILLTMNVLAMI